MDVRHSVQDGGKNLSSECLVIASRCALSGRLDLKRDLLPGHTIIDLRYILAKRIYPAN